MRVLQSGIRAHGYREQRIMFYSQELYSSIINLSDSDVEDTFSSTHSPDYIPALSDYSLASPGNTSPNFSDDLTKDLLSSLSISLFHDMIAFHHLKLLLLYQLLLRDVAVYYHFAISTFPVKIVIRSSAFILEYLLQLPIRFASAALLLKMRELQIGIRGSVISEQGLASAAIFVKMGVLQIGIRAHGYREQVMSSSSHSTIVTSDSDIEDTFSSTNILNYFPASSGNIFPKSSEKISSPKDAKTPVGSPISIYLSSSVGSSSPVRSTTPPPDYLFDESIFVELDNSLWIISRPLGNKPILEEPNESNAC
ncbi:hypothetical protein Tco_1244122 [Tanacetum coccineum]